MSRLSLRVCAVTAVLLVLFPAFTAPGWITTSHVVPAATAAPSTVLKTWAGYWNVPTMSALRIARSDIITTSTAKMQSEPGTFAQIRTANPDAKIIFYWFSAKAETWYSNWSTIRQNESWFLHNPDLSGASASRVRRYLTPSNTSVRYIMDMRRSAFRSHAVNNLTTLMARWNADGVFEDGPDETVRLHALGYWIVGPLQAQKDLWRADNPNAPYIDFLTQLRATAPDSFVITNTTIQWPSSTSYVSDSLYLPYVDGTMMEGAYHNPWDAAGTLQQETSINHQMAMIQRNLNAKKILIAYAGASNSDSTAMNRVFNFALAMYLLQADGVYLHFGWREWGNSVFSDSRYAYMKTITDDLGAPSGP